MFLLCLLRFITATFLYNNFVFDIVGEAASIKYMCVTPKELRQHLSEFGEYCPVSLADQRELLDCSGDTTNDLLTEFQGKYYKFGTEEKMKIFLNMPNKYIPPFAPNKLPAKENLPIRRSAVYVKKAFPAQIELRGYCPVTYLDGNLQ